MGPTKSSRTKEDRLRKRKREIQEAEIRSKRPRAQEATEEQSLELKPLRNGVQQLGSSGESSLIKGEAGWRVSKPIGGRMLDIDPVLTEDNQYIIVTYNTSIQVYSAVDSLIIRRISVSTSDASSTEGSAPARISASRLSKHNPDHIWVACSNGKVYRIDWTKDAEALDHFYTLSGTARALATVPTTLSGANGEILVIAESDKSNRLDLVAYHWDLLSAPKSKQLVSFNRLGDGLQLLESSSDGQVLTGALNDRLFIGRIKEQRPDNLEQFQYDFFSFDAPDLITSLDLRLYKRGQSRGKKGKPDSGTVADVIVGCARGAIYAYHDAIGRCELAEKGTSGNEVISAQKLHWHRKAVHAVKWSRDGHYVISGGSENVLVLWQMDTSKKDFLPHLAGSVENLVVSADGSSYAVHLDDNSTMILSTAEMRPTFYVSGLQTAVTDAETPKDLLVKRVWGVAGDIRRSIPAAIRATEPSKLHVCVGNGRQATMSGRFSAPLLQTVDLETLSSVTKQALARTQPTDLNLNNKGHTVDEPFVTHVTFSGDGKWLASVDDWQPAARDYETVSVDLREDFIRERREIYLKFWEVEKGSEAIALVSRVNGPHSGNSSEPVLDLAADPSSAAFATIGGDGLVRVWRPNTRHQNGVLVKGRNGQGAVSWACSDVIAVGEDTGEGAITGLSNGYIGSVSPQGKLSYSEDGSTLFVASGAADCGSVHIIDTTSGKIVKSLENLWKGQLHSIRTLAQYIIVLSDDLLVYDIVSDELRYGIVIPKTPHNTELLQLAVDTTSGHFAVTLPLKESSSIGLFSPEDPAPLLVKSTMHRIVSLASAPSSSGFIALDDAAQLWTITKGTDSSAIMTAQPLEDINLNGNDSIIDPQSGQDGIVGGDILMANGDEAEEEEEDDIDDAQDMDVDEDDIPVSVIQQQSLAEIFDAAPAFAASSVEDMFYKVAGLLATKPLSDAAI